jgi:hypothetical protein
MGRSKAQGEEAIMAAIDVWFLVAFVAGLTGLLFSSRVIRAIAWDTLRHPFTKATIIVHEDRIEVLHDTAADKAATLSSSGSR